MIKAVCASLLIFLVGFADAAAPITHTYLAHRCMDICLPGYTKAERRLCIVGTNFPDIRYLGYLKREDTHVCGVTLYGVCKAPTPFEVGRLLHSFVDEQREHMVVEWEIYDLLTDIPVVYHAAFLKFVEDAILFERASYSDDQLSFFDLYDDERAFGMADKPLRQWHAFIVGHLRMGPVKRFEALRYFGQGLLTLIPADVAAVWADLLPRYRDDAKMLAYVDKLVHHFDTLFASHATGNFYDEYEQIIV